MAKQANGEWDGDSFAARLAFVMAGRTPGQFAKRVHDSYQNIQRYLKGTQPGAGFIGKLATYEKVNPLWLLTGEGEPFLGKSSGAMHESGTEREGVTPIPMVREREVERVKDVQAEMMAAIERFVRVMPDDAQDQIGVMLVRPPGIMTFEDYYERFVVHAEDMEGFVPVPIQRGKVGAGPAKALSITPWAYAMFPAAMLPCAQEPSRYSVVRIDGDSMSPAIDDGALALIDAGQCDPHEANGQIVLADTRRHTVLKYLRLTETHFELHSANASYSPVMIPRRGDRNPILGVLVAVWYGHVLEPPEYRPDLPARLRCAAWRPPQKRTSCEVVDPTPRPGYHIEVTSRGKYMKPDRQPDWLMG